MCNNLTEELFEEAVGQEGVAAGRRKQNDAAVRFHTRVARQGHVEPVRRAKPNA